MTYEVAVSAGRPFAIEYAIFNECTFLWLQTKVDRLRADLPVSCVRNTAIARAPGSMFLESVMA